MSPVLKHDTVPGVFTGSRIEGVAVKLTPIA